MAVSIRNKFFGTSMGADELTDVSALVSRTIQLALAIAGIIFVFLLIAGGIGIIAGAGSNNPEGVEKGKKAVTSALIGFLVVFGAYWIVRVIELITGLTLVSLTP